MIELIWPLAAAVLGGALLQAATGIGFGLVAGPLMLAITDDPATVQTTIVLSLLVSALLARGIWPQVDRRLLRRLSLATLIGAPAGALLFAAADATALKLGAGVAVIFMTLAAAGLLPASRGDDWPAGDSAIGALSGAMSAALAMPGPAVASYMTMRGRAKAATRATTLSLFLISYPIAFATQALIVGISQPAMALTWRLAPAAALGALLGAAASRRLSERLFRAVIIAALAATAAALIGSLLL